MAVQLRLNRDTDPGPAQNGRPRRLSLEEILDGRREVIIQHGGEDYRLRLTSNNKLLLTK
jgi:hemin uptake protein HemP